MSVRGKATVNNYSLDFMIIKIDRFGFCYIIFHVFENPDSMTEQLHVLILLFF